jgi:5-methylcytosine-specific restriction endonuclease McrA
MVQRYLDASSVKEDASAPAFVEPGHCLWCNSLLTGRATRFCSLKSFPKEEYYYYADSPCAIHFSYYWYARPAYQRAVLIRDNFTCQKCGLHPMRKDKPWLPDLFQLHVDHIIPISKVGFTEMINLQTLCARCNLKKGAKVPGEEPPGIPSSKVKRNGYPEGRCPICLNTSYWLITWTPPVGIDEKMRQVQCRRCCTIYYLAPIFN